MNHRSFRASSAIVAAAALLLALATVTPAAAKGPRKIGFSSTTYSVNEGGGSAQITIVRSATRGAASVLFYTGPSTSATPNVDFTPVSTTVSFAAGESSATVQVPVRVDGYSGELDETVPLALSGPSKGYKLGTASATLTIVELPAPPAPNIDWLNGYNVAEFSWTFTWGYPATFSVFRSDTGDVGTYERIASQITDKHYTDSNVVIGDTYWYLVGAENEDFRVTYSSAVSITVMSS